MTEDHGILLPKVRIFLIGGLQGWSLSSTRCTMWILRQMFVLDAVELAVAVASRASGLRCS